MFQNSNPNAGLSHWCELRPTRSTSATGLKQELHTVRPLVSCRTSTSLQVVKSNSVHCDLCCKNSPQLGRSHRHQSLDSVRPTAVNRRPASKPNCGRSQKTRPGESTTCSTAGLAMQCALHVRRRPACARLRSLVTTMSVRCGACVGSGSVGGGKRHRVHHTNRLTKSNGNVRSQTVGEPRCKNVQQ